MSAAHPTPGQTVGPFFAFALPYDGYADAGRRPATRTRSGCTGGSSTAPASRCPTRWSSCGRPTGRGRADAGLAARDGHVHRLGPGGDRRRRPLRVHRTARARCAAVLRDDGLRPRPAGPAVHPRLPAATTRRRRRSSRRSPRTVRRTLVATADERGYVFDIRLQGDGETVFLAFPRRLTRMSDLFWPGDDRAGDHLTGARSSGRWSRSRRPGSTCSASRRDAGRCPDCSTRVGRRRPRRGGNPVPVARDDAARTARTAEAARWLHRGLTSQDVVDSALMMLLRDAVAAVRRELRTQVGRSGRPRRGPPGHPDGGAHPDPARRADHVRPQGRPAG